MMYRFSLAQACRQILLIFAGLVIPVPLHPAVPAQKRGALIALYNGTDGANWKNKTNWLGAVGTECTWHGVRCNDTGSSITALILGDRGRHAMTAPGNQLRGTIPAELGNLTSLEALDLSFNQLSGSIPSQLGNLRNLRSLYLFHNQLSGRIPAQLGNLRNLGVLYLFHNQLSGTIPAELGNLTHLESLMLFSNQLSGTIPTRLGNLTSLTSLELSSNQLSGSIPAQLGALPKLIRDLRISYNALYTNDSSLMNSLNAKSPGWRNTQTVAPVGLAARAQSASSIEVSWTPIAYSADPGRYVVLQSTLRGGPYSPAGSTADKTVYSLTVTGLRP